MKVEESDIAKGMYLLAKNLIDEWYVHARTSNVAKATLLDLHSSGYSLEIQNSLAKTLRKAHDEAEEKLETIENELAFLDVNWYPEPKINLDSRVSGLKRDIAEGLALLEGQFVSAEDLEVIEKFWKWLPKPPPNPMQRPGD